LLSAEGFTARQDNATTKIAELRFGRLPVGGMSAHARGPQVWARQRDTWTAAKLQACKPRTEAGASGGSRDGAKATRNAQKGFPDTNRRCGVAASSNLLAKHFGILRVGVGCVAFSLPARASLIKRPGR